MGASVPICLFTLPVSVLSILALWNILQSSWVCLMLYPINSVCACETVCVLGLLVCLFIYQGAGDWTQDLAHAKQVLYHWATPQHLECCFCCPCFVFLDGASLCSSGWPWTDCVDGAGLKLTVVLILQLGLQACTITAGQNAVFNSLFWSSVWALRVGASREQAAMWISDAAEWPRLLLFFPGCISW